MRERSKSCCWEVTCRLGRGGQARGRSPVRGSRAPKTPEATLVQGLGTPSHLSPREKLRAKAPTVNKLRPWANAAQARPGIAVALCQLIAHRLDKQEVPKEVP